MYQNHESFLILYFKKCRISFGSQIFLILKKQQTKMLDFCFGFGRDITWLELKWTFHCIWHNLCDRHRRLAQRLMKPDLPKFSWPSSNLVHQINKMGIKFDGICLPTLWRIIQDFQIIVNENKQKMEMFIFLAKI